MELAYAWISLLTLITGSRAAQLSWAPFNSDVIKRGDDVRVRCTAENAPPSTDIGFYMKLERLTERDDGTIEGHTIATNQEMDTNYIDDDRYSVQYSSLSESSRFIELSITGIRGQDAGQIRCKAPNSESTTHVLVVSAPLSKLVFYAIDEEGNRTEITETRGRVTLKEGKNIGVQCAVSVTGSNASPSARVFVGGREGVNKTDEFKEDTKDTMERVEGAPPGIMSYSRETTLTYRSISPPWQWDGSTLRCEGEMPGFGSQPIEVTLRVEHIPVIACEETGYKAKVGATVTIVCTAYANPAGSVAVAWGDNMFFDSPQTSGRYKYEAEQSAGERGEMRLVFTISQIEAADFEERFTFSCENSYGEATPQVVEVNKDDDNTSRAPVAAAPGLALLATALLAVLTTPLLLNQQ